MSPFHRWLQRIYSVSLIAVVFTTIFSWFNLNSVCIMLLVAIRLLEGDLAGKLKAAFTNKVFLAYFAFFAIEAAGYLHTGDLMTQEKMVTKEATLVALAFVFCTGGNADGRSYRQLLAGYYFSLAAASLYCLIIAFRNYLLTRDLSVFFYHLLTRPISQNAVFFSVYVTFGLLFLLSPEGRIAEGRLSARGAKVLNLLLILFFLFMIVLLNSKLMLVIALLIWLNSVLQKYSFRKNRRLVLVSGSILFLFILALALTDNPISARYRDMASGDLKVVRQETFSPDMYFNPLQLRLLEWRFAREILNAKHAWLFGVSPGDSQDLLDQKYIATHMYIGNPEDGPDRKIRGFIGYNFHNQYLQTLVQSGAIGLAALLAIFASLFARAGKQRKREGWFVILIIAVFFIPEAPLTMQHGVFLFCFFPLLLLYSPEPPMEKPILHKIRYQL